MTRPLPTRSTPSRLRAALTGGLATLALPGAIALPVMLPAGPAAAQSSLSETLKLDPEDRAVLRAEIRKYLLENPEVIMEAVKVLEDRRLAAETAAAQSLVADNAQAIFDDGYSHVAGNPQGDVTVVEFLDYNCGYCKKAHDEVRELVASDPGIRYIVKEFPILGPTSLTAAKAAMAALRQQDGKLYMAYNAALMNHRGPLTDEQVWLIAEDVGLDVDQLKRDAESKDIARSLNATRELAKKLDIRGTPTFVVGEEMVRGYAPLDHMRETVAAHREKQG